MSDYDNYDECLAFEPELTWEEFCEWAKEKKYQADFKLDAIVLRNVVALTMAGDVLINAKTCLVQIADNRTPEQMKTIIEALRG